MRARTHTHTHPIHSPTHWAWVWVLTDLKKTSPRLRIGHFQRSRKIWHLTLDDLMRAHARAHAHSHTSQTHAHSVGMCLDFYRPQKDLSWAENQKFKEPEIFGTFASLFHGVQYCTIGLESPRPLRGRGLYKNTLSGISQYMTPPP